MATLLANVLPVRSFAQESVSPEDLDARVQGLLAEMSPAERVGQLFIISFEGEDVGPESDIARLVQDYKVGGVILSPAARNIRNTGVDTPTPIQVASLVNRLQALALAEPISLEAALSALPPASTPETVGTEEAEPSEAESGRERRVVPLLIAVKQEGDGYPFTVLRSGFTPLPANMALGATWNPEAAFRVGEVVGRELGTVGINMLLGPSLDALDRPRPDFPGELGMRTFGGDPYWVGKLGRAYIAGVHSGSGERVATIAKHFPGQGGSDRRPDDEVATLQKSLQELRRHELSPFASAASVASVAGPSGAATVTNMLSQANLVPPTHSTFDSADYNGTADGFLSSHIRYSGFQGAGRERTPPISLASELGAIMALDEFRSWHNAGGLLVSDSLGAPPVQRYYDASGRQFPYRQVVQDAFLAGNDLLLLSNFSLTDDWTEQMSNIIGTITFFQQKYVLDMDFQARVDRAVERILRLKVRLYPDGFALDNVWVDAQTAVQRVGKNLPVSTSVARQAVTLVWPGPHELADRLPTGPQSGEQLLIVTDARLVRECPTCEPEPLLEPEALRDTMLRLYGPDATRQVAPEDIEVLTFTEMNALLQGALDEERTAEVDDLIRNAQWLIFGMLDVNREEFPDSDAVKQFLRLRSDSLRDKKLIVLAYSAPYFLDTTEISKLTAYYAVFGKTEPFVEASIRALFREFVPEGSPPVSITGIYDLFEATEPDPNLVIPLTLADSDGVIESLEGVEARVGDTIKVIAGPLLDRNWNPVPDGTRVDFIMRYAGEEIELPRQEANTVDGFAATAVRLDRAGELRIYANSGGVERSNVGLVIVQGNESPVGGVLIGEGPTPTAPAQPAPTPRLVLGAPFDDPTPAERRNPPVPRVDLVAMLVAIMAVVVAVVLGYFVIDGDSLPPPEIVQYLLWGGVTGLLMYIVYGLGWLPGSTWMQLQLRPWGAGLIAFAGALLPVVWIRLRWKWRL